MAKPQKEQVQLFFVVVWKLGLVLQKAVSKRVPIRRANRIVGKKWHFLRYIELNYMLVLLQNNLQCPLSLL